MREIVRKEVDVNIFIIIVIVYLKVVYILIIYVFGNIFF